MLVDFSASTIALLVVCPLLAFFFVRWLSTEDNEIQHKRQSFITLAGQLQAYGLVAIPKLFVLWGTVTLGGLPRLIARTWGYVDHLVSDPKHLMTELDGAFFSILANKLKGGSLATVLQAIGGAVGLSALQTAVTTLVNATGAQASGQSNGGAATGQAAPTAGTAKA